jgi:hypothetical protein
MRDNQIPRLSMIQDQMLEGYKLESMAGTLAVLGQ